MKILIPFSQILNCIHNTTPGLKKSMAALSSGTCGSRALCLSLLSVICNSAPRSAARDMNNVWGAVRCWYSKCANLLKQTQIGNRSSRIFIHSRSEPLAGLFLSSAACADTHSSLTLGYVRLCVCVCVCMVVFAVHDTWYCTKLIFSFHPLYWGGGCSSSSDPTDLCSLIHVCPELGGKNSSPICLESQCSRGNLR